MELPSSLRMDGGVLVFPDSVCVLHENDAGEVPLVRQSRPVHGRESLELPGGRVEEGESLVQAALRELSEESGCVGEDAEELVTLDMDLSVSVHRTHLVRVHKLATTSNPSEFDLVWLPAAEALGKVFAGEITHAPTVAGLLFLAREEQAREWAA
jgi:ADP-ribose pyrophosphatase